MKFKALAIAAGLAAISSAAQAADYLPFGVQNNVNESTVLGGGWSECYSEAYGANGTSISSILSGCSAGSRLMLAGRATGSDTLLVLAQAATSDVTFNTGGSNNTHNANGVEWYFSNNYSWGFAPGGSSVSLNSCDIQDSTSFGTGPTVNQRLCWHTGGGAMNGGWRIGAIDFLNSSSDYEKVIFTYTGDGGGAVPEPATWALMIGGFGLAGASLRRRRAVTA
ncbi:MAG: PEP-CTERM sorting domain-containing protein [Phenylobacterium sp.]|uniref:PEPxxWA-CTERM sorting domain-containing protein n=1 Tax=Phenylobacterium sp. TaxID=1871053 RepID=UPI001A4D9846|nr:PEPxxWA-CTERM sorting domain-containing protein [Phenylobacterium sp.]MBL8771604.1 PEP-CTERM sorting domain-containing protein [Phenylobacterium sp.]